eukprot:1180823-Prorocentrum_minimum.AAC.2
MHRFIRVEDTIVCLENTNRASFPRAAAKCSHSTNFSGFCFEAFPHNLRTLQFPSGSARNIETTDCAGRVLRHPSSAYTLSPEGAPETLFSTFPMKPVVSAEKAYVVLSLRLVITVAISWTTQLLIVAV